MERFRTLFWLLVLSGAISVTIIVFMFRLASSILQEWRT